MTGIQREAAWYDETIKDQTELLIIMAICDESDAQGRARPRIQDICRKARCSERTAQNGIRSLAKQGKISVLIRPGTSSEYQIMDSKICTPAISAPPQKLPPLGAKIAPHTISSIKELSINKGSTISENEMPKRVVKSFDPDEVEQSKKRKIQNPNNRVDLLEPQTKGERILFGTLQAEIIKLHGPNWRGIPKRFPSFACKESFAECESRLNGELTKAINAGVQKGIREIDNLVKYTHAIAFKEDKEHATSADLLAAGYKL
jgi:hypothetical protein